MTQRQKWQNLSLSTSIPELSQNRWCAITPSAFSSICTFLTIHLVRQAQKVRINRKLGINTLKMGTLAISPEHRTPRLKRAPKFFMGSAVYSKISRTGNVCWTLHSPRDMQDSVKSICAVASFFLKKNLPQPHHFLVFPDL